MTQPARKNFHVPLSPEAYDALKEQSERLSTSATVLAREAISSWLEAQRAKLLAQDIEAYALAASGSDDLDLELAAAAAEELLEADR